MSSETKTPAAERIAVRAVRRSGHGRRICCAVLAAAVFAAVEAPASAAPWDIDMYRQSSLQSNEVARGPVKGTVPVGRKPFTMTLEEAGEKLQNTEPFGTDTVWRGQRLYNANCSTCHGLKGNGGGILGQFLPVPSLLQDMYKSRTDGHIYGTIHLGGAVMPRYGFKLSDREHWDLVNYVRFLQGRDVPEVVRPQ